MIAPKTAKQGIDQSRLWRAGLLAAALAIAANAIIRTIAVALFEIEADFRPLTWPQFILFTALGVLGATLVYARLLRTAARPAGTFRMLAASALVVSFVPDVVLLVSQAVPGMTVPAFAALIAMHVATAAITVRVLAGCRHFG
jgi:hypothetical protein